MKSYVLTQNYKAPYVIATGHPRNPQSVMMKSFRNGEIVKGELKHANNKPAFILVAGTLVLPLSVVKEVTTKEVISNATGANNANNTATEVASTEKIPNKKLKYIDSVLIGTVLGFGAIYLAENQGWLPEGSDIKKYRMYGALGGALIGAYFVFRQENTITVKTKTNE